MKHFLLFMSLFFVTTSEVQAQCNSKFKFESSQTEYLDSNKVIQRIVEEKSTIIITESQVDITPGSEEKKRSGMISAHHCAWRIPYKEGKSTIRAILVDNNEKKMPVTLTIEAANEKATLLFQMDERPGMFIRVKADKFEQLPKE
jgi:hypothetical protein